MTQKKLALVASFHEAPEESEGKNTVRLVFNRPLHRLEAMGIAMMVEAGLKKD